MTINATIFRAAQPYYQRNMRQDEVAKVLGVSRASVAHYLQKARDAGFVEIKIRSDLFRHHALAAQLEKRFALQAVYVVDMGADDAQDASLIFDDTVRLGATVLLENFDDYDRLGVAWGRTLHALSEVLPASPRKGAMVYQLCGNLGAPFGHSSEACSSRIARRFNATNRTLYAPLVLSSAKLADALRREPIIADQLEAHAQCNKIVFSIGDCGKNSHVVKCGAVSAEELDEYVAAGARGVIAGRFINEAGAPMPYKGGDRFIGVRLEDLYAASFRLAIAAGVEKADAVRAGLTGNFATHLVIDRALAEAVLALDEGQEEAEKTPVEGGAKA